MAVVGRLVQIWERESYTVYTKGDTIHKTTQQHRIHKIGNKNLKQKEQT
jgi:hypothetical protein